MFRVLRYWTVVGASEFHTFANIEILEWESRAGTYVCRSFSGFPEHSENVLLILLVIQDLSLTLPKDQAMLNFPITDFDP